MTISHLFVRRFGPVGMNKRPMDADGKKSIKFFIFFCLVLLISQFMLMYFFSPIIGTTNLTINQNLFTVFIAFFQFIWALLINVSVPDDLLGAANYDDEDEDDKF